MFGYLQTTKLSSNRENAIFAISLDAILIKELKDFQVAASGHIQPDTVYLVSELVVSGAIAYLG